MYRLNRYVLKLALADARQFIDRGMCAEDAAIVACRGAWQKLIPSVLAALQAEGARRLAGLPEPPAAPRRLDL